MRVLKTSLALMSLGLLMSTLSGCVASAAHAVFAPALDSAIQSHVENNATAESMGVSTTPYRTMDCASLDRNLEAYRRDQYKPEHSALTSKYFGWQIDAMNQVRAEKACDGDAAAQAAAQAAAPKLQLYGFCYYSPVGNGADPDDYDTYITPNFTYPVADYTAVAQAQTEFTAYLRTTSGLGQAHGICMVEGSLASLDALRSKVSAESDFLVGNDDVAIAWQPSAPSVAPVAPAPTTAAAPAPQVVAAAAPSAPVPGVAPSASGRGWLGAYLGDPTPRLAQELGLQGTQGALILGVAKDSAASRTGLRSLDVVQSMDGQTIANHQQLLQLIAAKPAGASVAFEVWRERRTQSFTALLSATATPSQIASGPGYCYAVLATDGMNQIAWLSSPFPVPDTTTSGLQARGKIVGEQFRSFIMSLGMASEIGNRMGFGICNAGLGNVEFSRNAMVEAGKSAAYANANVEQVSLVWQP